MLQILRERESGKASCPVLCNRQGQYHSSLVRRLSLEGVLRGHEGCVNRCCWNQTGDLLASVSDDTQLLVWNYCDRYTKSCSPKVTIDTGHSRNIFGVRFIPGSGDSSVATGAMDCEVRVHLSLYESPVTLSYECHTGRVKELEASYSVPNVFWSASEDGTVRQFDTRLPPSLQNQPSSRNVLIKLGYRRRNRRIRAMGLCCSPANPHYLAVACGDPLVRMYDRRMNALRCAKEGGSTVPLLCFCPPHLASYGSNSRVLI